jgi:hypothetical protein
MLRAIVLVCAVCVLSSQPTFAREGQLSGAEAKPVTVTATIEAIDKANRTVILKGPQGVSVEINAPEQMEGFNSLKVGDQVTATYFEAIAVNVRKPGEPAPSADPTTVTQRKDRKPGSETRRLQTLTATVEAIDAKAPAVTLKGPQGRVVRLPVRDAAQLKSVKVGDTVDVTHYESLLVSVARPRQQ